MSDFNQFEEPVPDHLADTGPIRSIQVDEPTPVWRRAIALLSLLGTAALTVATVFVLLNPQSMPTPQEIPSNPEDAANPAIPTALPTSTPVVNQVILTSNNDALPTLAPEMIAALLATPVLPAVDNSANIEIVRDFYNPFTIIPDRPRSEVIEYEVVSGDTIYTIAERFGLQPESIAWANDRAVVQALRPGQRINILPVDGVYAQAIGSKTIADLAAEYRVDSYAIIDSEYNDLFTSTPDTVLPSGMQVVIPGGQAEQISWNPVVERTGGGGGGGGAGGTGTISFAPGEPGSCGAVENPGGGAFWQRPLGNYTFIRGFSSWHTGVDLSSPIGTPVFAANSGRVIFAGWNSWGYGYTVVLAHGPYTTLYGHLDSYGVSCGQSVSAGDFIATTGNSGNSSGPHLHFEIRYLDTPTNPVSTLGF